jgi:pyruvate dehydrogenase E2 component (dihydrolipoamide acetyltransferase)
MITEVKIPKMSKSMEEAVIVELHVAVGDQVSRGQALYEIETDKACVEVEAGTDGFVKHILVQVGWILPVGTTVMILAGSNETVPQNLIDSLLAELPQQIEACRFQTDTVDADSLSQAISKSADTNQPEVKLGSTLAVNKLQKITAQRMLKSKSEIPCFYLNARADVTELVALRNRLNEKSEIKISFNDLIIKAVAAGLERFPIMTGSLSGDIITLAEQINVGLAASTSDGLIVPVIKNAAKKTVTEIARDRAELITKAQNKRLSPDDLDGACITISNLGPFGVDSFIPIVVPGQCSIIGVGRIADTPVPNPEQNTAAIAVRKLMNLTISVDHRIANGAYASEFLDFVKKYLEDISNFN